MTLYPETAIVFIFWMASLVACFYGRAWVDDRKEVKRLQSCKQAEGEGPF